MFRLVQQRGAVLRSLSLVQHARALSTQTPNTPTREGANERNTRPSQTLRRDGGRGKDRQEDANSQRRAAAEDPNTALLGEITNPGALRARGSEVVNKDVIDDSQLYFALMNTANSTLTCSPSGRCDLARFFWRKASENPTFVPKDMHYFAFLKSMVENGDRVAIHDIIKRMNSAGIKQTAAFSELAAQAFAMYGDIEGVRKCMQNIKSEAGKLTEVPYIALIEAHAYNRDMEGALAVLDEMTKERVAIGARTYTALLVAASEVSCKHSRSVLGAGQGGSSNQIGVCINILDRMQSASFRPNFKAFNALLRVYANAEQEESHSAASGDDANSISPGMARIREVLVQRERAGYNKTSAETDFKLVSSALKGEVSEMKKVIKELVTKQTTDHHSLTSVFCLLKDRNDGQTAEALYRILLDSNIYIYQDVTQEVFRALSASGLAIEARRLLSTLLKSSRWQKDLSIYNEVMSSLATSSLNERETSLRVRNLLQQIRDDRLYANSGTYSAVCDVWSTKTPNRDTKPSEIEKIIESIHATGVAPNHDFWIYLIRAYAHSSHADKVKRTEEAVRRMQAAGINKTLPVYKLLIELYIESGLESQAKSVLDELTQNKNIPKCDASIYAPFIRHHIRSGDKAAALALIEDLKSRGLELTPAIFYPLFENAPSAEDAVATLNYMTEMGVEPDARVFDALFKIYGSLNDVDSLKVLMDMTNSSKLSEDASTSILISSASKPFSAVRSAVELLQNFGKPLTLAHWQEFLKARKAAGIKDSREDSCFVLSSINKAVTRGYLNASVYAYLIDPDTIKEDITVLGKHFENASSVAIANFSAALFTQTSKLSCAENIALCEQFCASSGIALPLMLKRLYMHYLSNEDETVTETQAENAMAVLERLQAAGSDLSQFRNVARLMISVSPKNALSLLDIIVKNNIPMGDWRSQPLGVKLYQQYAKEENPLGAIEKACASKGITLPDSVRQEIALQLAQNGQLKDLSALEGIKFHDDRARAIAIGLCASTSDFSSVIRFIKEQSPACLESDSFQCVLVAKAKETNRVTGKEVLALIDAGLFKRSSAMLSLLIREFSREEDVEKYILANGPDFANDPKCALGLISFYGFRNKKDETRALYNVLSLTPYDKESNALARTYTSAIQAESRWGDHAKCIALYEEAKSKGVNFGIGEVISLLFSLTSSGGLHLAPELLSRVEDRPKSFPVSLLNAFVSYFQKKKDLANTSKWFDIVSSYKTEPTSYTYSPMITALCDAGEVQKAIEMYKKLGDAKAEDNPNFKDVKTFLQSAILKACVEKGAPSSVLNSFLEDIKANDKNNRAPAYRSLFTAYLVKNDVKSAIALLEDAEANTPPQANISSFLVRGLVNKGDIDNAELVLEKSKYITVRSILDVIGSYAASGNVEKVDSCILQLKSSEGNISEDDIKAIHAQRFRAYVNKGEGEEKLDSLLDTIQKDVKLTPDFAEKLRSFWTAQSLDPAKFDSAVSARAQQS